MPKKANLKKVMVIGSGPIIIGQAAEFDYAGSQACRALKEEGLEVVLVNSNPATIFMGDTGSLALGGTIGTVAVATKHEIVMAIIGGLFVMETLSVIIQVGFFKMTGRRVFLMAPIHHHFQKLGWPETKVVQRFWIISLLLAAITLVTLKIR